VLAPVAPAIRGLSRQLTIRIVVAAAAAAAITELAVWKLSRLHGGMLYPDGYQYLVMSRGIAENGRAVFDTGRGGDVLLPNADAALKPFEPLLVALLHLAGLGWWDAASIVTAGAAVGVVLLAGALTWHVTRSKLFAGSAAALCIASPSVTWWSAFLGPDAVAPCMGLAALLAALRGRPQVAGVLAGLAATSRPEYALAAGVPLIGMLIERETRQAAARGFACALLTMAAVIAVTRPPLGVVDGRQLALAGGAVILAGMAWTMVPRLAATSWAATAGMIGAIGVALTAGLAGRAEGLHVLASDQPLIIGLVALGLVLAAAGERRVLVIRLTLLIGTMLLIYWEKNPNLDRYPTQLLPLAIVLALAGLARIRRPGAIGLAPVLVAVATLAVWPAAAPIATDTFRTVAAKLPSEGPALISATPDAYSFWLPHRAHRMITPHSHGLFIVDGATRSLTPLRVCGRVLRRISSEPGFAPPYGEVDIEPAELMTGSARSRCT
jgi:hypothetical protein